MEVEETIVEDEFNIEDQNQDPEIGPRMYISCIFDIHFL